MNARLQELRAERPDVALILELIPESRHVEWLHGFGPSYDDQLRKLLPPIAPLALRSITAQQDEVTYRWRGAVDISRIFELYDTYAQYRPARPRAFDFGCGAGRLTRYLSLSSDYESFASDANPDHVDWCSANLSNITTRLNSRCPPLPFDNDLIDFAYAWSVFTHLDRSEATDWFGDLARIIRPGGILIATILRSPGSGDTDDIRSPSDDGSNNRGNGGGPDRTVASGEYVFLPYEEPTVKLANVGPNYGNVFIDTRRWVLCGKQASSYWLICQGEPSRDGKMLWSSDTDNDRSELVQFKGGTPSSSLLDGSWK